ncbi:hypothetical protein [Flavobacterium sp. FlaQc-48]|uniref:hypothetical protein n=1 Tax=Flavobacterium sp. FlaQc-48 TaxID=3374181 RepID=UPI00375633BC
MIKIFVTLFISLSISIGFSQGKNIGLEKMLLEHGLTDYGYGLTKLDKRNDSIFDYHRIGKSNIRFKELKNISYCLRMNNLSTVKIKKTKKFISDISISTYNYKLTSDYLETFDSVSKGYYFQLLGSDYYLLYLSNSRDINIRNQILGILINIRENKVVPFPELQSSDSLLPLTDFNCGQNLYYISYNPSFKNTVDIYALKNNIFEKESTINLLNFDGYAWTINYDDILKNDTSSSKSSKE